MKKLDAYVLKKFCLVFVAAFFICLFVFMMQLTWKYVEVLVGKGLTVDVLWQFFYYMALSLVPQSLPLALLLTSLISFGNMGETLELLAMRSAGVPLRRIMMPLLGLAAMLCGLSFYFQNQTAPQAQLHLSTLLISMKQTSPAMEIPEGVFYNGVPDVNIYVSRKDARTSMLYDLIVYKTDEGFDRAQIVVADSGRLEMSADKRHLRLDIWNGKQFESLQGGGGGVSGIKTANLPFDRETFKHKGLLIDFDANFNVLDSDLLRGAAQTKNMAEIVESVDSMEAELDSMGRRGYWEVRRAVFPPARLKGDELRALAHERRLGMAFDSLTLLAGADRRAAALGKAHGEVRQRLAAVRINGEMQAGTLRMMRSHWIEWNQKITLSLACVLFFLIGAPLGAIIRKGGLGLPSVVAVLIFIFYYIVSTSTMKMARDGSVNVVLGMWTSTAILLPVSLFLTYKANNDSVVFNLDAYRGALRRFLGLREGRNLQRKEVVIHDPDYGAALVMLAELRSSAGRFVAHARGSRLPSYWGLFLGAAGENDEAAGAVGLAERLVETLANSRDVRLLHELNGLPVMSESAHLSPFRAAGINRVMAYVFPLGLLIWLRACFFRRRLVNDMRLVEACCARIEAVVRPLVEK